MPPMILLTRVENAIKHGLSPLPQGGTLDVSATRAGHVLCSGIRCRRGDDGSRRCAGRDGAEARRERLNDPARISGRRPIAYRTDPADHRLPAERRPADNGRLRHRASRPLPEASVRACFGAAGRKLPDEIRAAPHGTIAGIDARQVRHPGSGAALTPLRRARLGRGPWKATLAQTFQSGYIEGPLLDGTVRRVGPYSVWDAQASYSGVRNLTMAWACATSSSATHRSAPSRLPGSTPRMPIRAAARTTRA